MNVREIEELLTLMEKRGLKRMVVRHKDFEIELEKECKTEVIMAAPSMVLPAAAPAAAKGIEEKKSEGRFITSPIVGTFYASPSPKDGPFVKVGDKVEADQVVCIVEAMKVMNEVKAALKGEVVEILVKNGEPVEFGTKLYRVICRKFC